MSVACDHLVTGSAAGRRGGDSREGRRGRRRRAAVWLFGRGRLVFARKLLQQEPRDRVERGEYALTGGSDADEARHTDLAVVENEIEVVHRRGIPEVAFVILDDVGDLVEARALAHKVLFEVLEAFDVLFHLVPL